MIKVNIERETSFKDIDNTSLVEERNSKLFDMIKRVVIPATGCTEPVAIALNAATARKYFKGNIEKINIRLDISLIKNAMGVAIPGIKPRGIASCAAIGILIGNDEKGMNILSDACKFSDDDVESLLPIIEVSIAEGYEGLYIETILIGENECIRVITENTHSNITSIEH